MKVVLQNLGMLTLAQDMSIFVQMKQNYCNSSDCKEKKKREKWIKIHFKQFILWNRQKESHTRKGFVPSWNKQTAELLKTIKSLSNTRIYSSFSPPIYLDWKESTWWDKEQNMVETWRKEGGGKRMERKRVKRGYKRTLFWIWTDQRWSSGLFYVCFLKWPYSYHSGK